MDVDVVTQEIDLVEEVEEVEGRQEAGHHSVVQEVVGVAGEDLEMAGEEVQEIQGEVLAGMAQEEVLIGMGLEVLTEMDLREVDLKEMDLREEVLTEMISQDLDLIGMHPEVVDLIEMAHHGVVLKEMVLLEVVLTEMAHVEVDLNEMVHHEVVLTEMGHEVDLREMFLPEVVGLIEGVLVVVEALTEMLHEEGLVMQLYQPGGRVLTGMVQITGKIKFHLGAIIMNLNGDLQEAIQKGQWVDLV